MESLSQPISPFGQRICSGAVSVLLACASSAGAQADFSQTVVVTAAATPVPLGSVTRTVTVITRDQIAQLPAHTIADVLRLAASVDVRARGERGVQTDFAIRGAHFGQMLVLVDGVRLNDAQSGHHNGDIPIPLEGVERIEILHGPGSSLFGADAFGGTVNVITRRQSVPAEFTFQAGSFGLVGGSGQAAFGGGGVRQLFAANVERSDGFMFERGFDTSGFSSRTVFDERTNVLVSYIRKDFGANNFYGNAPSHEWTNQTLVVVDREFQAPRTWRVGATASYRTHGDRFLFNVLTPGVFENRHRTHAVLGAVKATRQVGTGGMVTAGMDAGGDWIRSSNLGDHETSRISAFGEWRHDVAPDVQVDASLRLDRYSEFGTAWSPSVGAGWRLAPAVRVRASIARAFRVPTFTERFYQDPANWARPEVDAETAWAGEAGADIAFADGWTATTTVFGRLEEDVIDWLRPTPDDRWRTYNIRNVDTVGIELGVARSFGDTAFFRVQYTGLDVRADAVTQLSKYVLDFAPHSLTGAAVLPLPWALRVAPRIEYKHRTRSSGRSEYTLLDVRVSRRVGLLTLFVEVANLFDQEYQEVSNVAMPGRSGIVGITVGAR